MGPTNWFGPISPPPIEVFFGGWAKSLHIIFASLSIESLRCVVNRLSVSGYIVMGRVTFTSSLRVASLLRHHCVIEGSIGRSCSLRVFSLAVGPPWPGGARVTRTGSGGQVRLCSVCFHSLGTLHSPIGAVAPWCYTYTTTARTIGCMGVYGLLYIWKNAHRSDVLEFYSGN